MLLEAYSSKKYEAGCDEAGRGCLAGPVVAAAVILDPEKPIHGLNDSKKLNHAQREKLAMFIKKQSIAYGIGICTVEEIDRMNILQASILAMHRALQQLSVQPEFIIVDGNRFISYQNIPFACIIGGDAKYASIAAASILAKTYRDSIMQELHSQFPFYQWNTNKGYPTHEHREALCRYGISPHHRKSFRLCYQMRIFQ